MVRYEPDRCCNGPDEPVHGIRAGDSRTDTGFDDGYCVAFIRRRRCPPAALTRTLLLNWFVPLYASVTDENDSVGVKCDVVFVGDENNGVALLVQPLEQRH